MALAATLSISSDRSLAQMSTFESAWLGNDSASAMAMLYGSCPDEHPADQIRTADPGASRWHPATYSQRKVKCAGSRKNEVWFTVLRSTRSWLPQPVVGST